MCMHVALQLKPFKARHSPNAPYLMVVDNVGFHHFAEVKAAAAAAGWLLMFLPPNITDELQPMDLVVNAVLNAEMRKLRMTAVMEYFTIFRRDYNDWRTACLDASKAQIL
jgi:hypothetical protein